MEKQLISSIREKRFYKPLVIAGAFLCLALILWLGSMIVTSPKWLQIDDYVEYWAAGKLNLSRGNPYDPDQLLPLQHEAGRFFGVPVMMWNPPWMLLLAMPFSIFEYPFSRVLWILFFILVVLISVNLTWILYGGSPGKKWIGWLLGFTFIPILEAFRTGQTGPLLLLGVACFSYFLDKEKLWLAGALLSLLFIKPHILYLFPIAVLLWSIYEKQFRVVLGTGITLAAATLIVWIINPEVLNQYLYAALTYPPQDWATPTIGGITRLLVGPEWFWLQFIPPLVGVIWLVFIWFRRRKSWDWIEVTPLIILVSILTAAYGWTSDQSPSLIAVIQIFILIPPINKRNISQLAVLSIYLLIEIGLLLPLGNQIWNFWLSPILLIWYLVAKNLLNGPEENINPQMKLDNANDISYYP